MGLIDQFKAMISGEAEPPAHIHACSPEKAVLQIARFERALSQATDPRKRNELNRWLAYYRNLASVERP